MNAPLLPHLTLHLWGQHLAWAVVLAALVGCLLQRTRVPVRRALMALAACAALVPGPHGPVYWLALAYQMPSLASIAVALWWLRGEATGKRLAIPTALWLGISAMGGVLLLDTLALLPWPIYAVGFGTQALTVWLVASALLCIRPDLRTWGWAGVLIGLVFAVTRLPTGNLWDALSDPWLSLLAVALVLRRVGRRNTV